MYNEEFKQAASLKARRRAEVRHQVERQTGKKVKTVSQMGPNLWQVVTEDNEVYMVQ